jgi:hypothetical protein
MRHTAITYCMFTLAFVGLGQTDALAVDCQEILATKTVQTVFRVLGTNLAVVHQELSSEDALVKPLIQTMQVLFDQKRRFAELSYLSGWTPSQSLTGRPEPTYKTLLLFKNGIGDEWKTAEIWDVFPHGVTGSQLAFPTDQEQLEAIATSPLAEVARIRCWEEK